MDGLGSDESDFDVYIVCDEVEKEEISQHNETFLLKGIEFDVEYHRMNPEDCVNSATGRNRG